MSYEQTEYQINDRLSFMRILGISLSDRVLDANTIWDFESTLAQAGVMAELFCMFDAMLEEGLITHKGTIIDASLVNAPRQRNYHDENKTLKAGNIPEERKSLRMIISFHGRIPMPRCTTVKDTQNYLKKQTKRCMRTVLIQVL